MQIILYLRYYSLTVLTVSVAALVKMAEIEIKG